MSLTRQFTYSTAHIFDTCPKVGVSEKPNELRLLQEEVLPRIFFIMSSDQEESDYSVEAEDQQQADDSIEVPTLLEPVGQS